MFRCLSLCITGALLVAISAACYLWSDRRQVELRESTRQMRVQLQYVEQTAQILKQSMSAASPHTFDGSIEALQIDVAQMLDKMSDHSDIEVNSFEQNKLISTFSSPYGPIINQLRVTFAMSATHIVAFLEGLDHFKKTLAPWPLEVRSCDIWRAADPLLTINCVLDIYHWTTDS